MYDSIARHEISLQLEVLNADQLRACKTKNFFDVKRVWIAWALPQRIWSLVDDAIAIAITGNGLPNKTTQ